jgi:L-malate glycosyltransferase
MQHYHHDQFHKIVYFLPAMRDRPLTIFIVHPSDLLTDYRAFGDGLVADCFIRYLAQRGHRLHVVVHEVDLQTPYPANVTLYPVHVSRWPHWLQAPLYLWRSRQIFNHITEPIDIIHQLNPVTTGRSLALWGAKPPIVLGPIVAHWPADAFPPKPNTTPSQTLLRSLLCPLQTAVKRTLFTWQQQQAARLLLATPAAYPRLTQPAPGKIHLLTPGIEPTLFAPLATPPDPNRPMILFVGGVSYRKGIYTLLEAFGHVVKAMPTCELVLITCWATELRSAYATLARLPYRHQIRVLENIPRVAIPHWMQRCTVYCMPSYGEPFGMGTLEAMACGKPIVGTRAGGLQYLIPDQGGRQVPPRNATALAAALLDILQSPELQQRMGQHNRRTVEAHYTWPRIIDQLEAVYQQLIPPCPSLPRPSSFSTKLANSAARNSSS